MTFLRSVPWSDTNGAENDRFMQSLRIERIRVVNFDSDEKSDRNGVI
jgi:hypothetical protein